VGRCVFEVSVRLLRHAYVGMAEDLRDVFERHMPVDEVRGVRAAKRMRCHRRVEGHESILSTSPESGCWAVWAVRDQ
jgi:hypothetical protein